MRKFFDSIIINDQAAHTFFFRNKPICFTGVILKDQHRTFNDILCLKGWYAFKKYEPFFPHSNFIFIEELYQDDYLKNLDIYVVNKKALIKCLYKYEDLFKNILGIDFMPEKFLFDLAHGAKLTALIHNDNMLLGILLGYGEESSKAFKEVQNAACQNYVPEWTETYCGIEGKRCKGCAIYPISFMGNPHSQEVQYLLYTYDEELDHFWEVYSKSRDPLKIILEAMCTP